MSIKDGSISEAGLAVIEYFARYLAHNKEQIKLEDRLVEGLGADSLDLIELQQKLEQLFDVAISDDDWEKVRTVHQAIQVVEKSLSQKEK